MHSSLAAFSSLQTQHGYTKILVNDGLSTVNSLRQESPTLTFVATSPEGLRAFVKSLPVAADAIG